MVAGRGQQSAGRKAQRRRGASGVYSLGASTPSTARDGSTDAAPSVCVSCDWRRVQSHKPGVCLEIVRILPSTPSCPDLSGGDCRPGSAGLLQTQAGLFCRRTPQSDRPCSKCEAASAPPSVTSARFPSQGNRSTSGRPALPAARLDLSLPTKVQAAGLGNGHRYVLLDVLLGSECTPICGPNVLEGRTRGFI